MGYRTQLGLEYTPQIQSSVSTSLFTAAAMDPEPFSKAALTAAAFFSKLFSFGYDPRKLNDTAVTEAFRIGMNGLWNDLTGDRLPTACEPGQCGEQRIAIFTRSSYPNVPYPAGRPGADAAQYLAALDAAYRDAFSKLVRQESIAGLDENYQYIGGLLRQVAAEQARQSSILPAGILPAGIADVFTTAGGGVDWGVVLPLIGGAALVYAAV